LDDEATRIGKRVVVDPQAELLPPVTSASLHQGHDGCSNLTHPNLNQQKVGWLI
jgi:hypothetical protein